MAARQPKAPAAFLSYAHLDDEASEGTITLLRQRLARAVSVAIGERFEIFQDRDGIGWGQHWPKRLDEALGQALFLIPILTPAYFKSRPCRDELQKFLELERRTGRDDLILPIYFYTARAFDERSDDLAQILSRRQYRDWRELRRKPIESLEVRQALEQLADEIEAAVHRPPPAAAGETTQPAAPAGDTAARPPAPAPPADRPIDLEPIEEERRIARTVALRAAPMLAARTVTRLKAGMVVYVTGRARGGGWLFVEEEGDVAGYVVEDAVELPAPAEAAQTTTTVRLAPPPPPPPPQPGRPFRDVEAPWCPELVVIPAGSFLMGSPEDEECRFDDEGPQHAVRIAVPFALGRYPVTFDEYDAFCAATVRDKPGDEGWGRGRRPAINVSWEDAQAYVAWLRERTGKPYRLPSEAEWEYACRAGTTTRYWWGDAITSKNANYGGEVGKTTEVGRYGASPWGLYDMHGNVWEWVEDRWRGSYEGAPTDGSAWVGGTQSARVVRGGSCGYVPGYCRSAARVRYVPGYRFVDLGFRVSRMLTP